MTISTVVTIKKPAAAVVTSKPSTIVMSSKPASLVIVVRPFSQGGGGSGVPDGGVTGDTLVKLSNVDGDADWADPFVEKAGDTMTGDLIIDDGADTEILLERVDGGTDDTRCGKISIFFKTINGFTKMRPGYIEMRTTVNGDRSWWQHDDNGAEFFLSHTDPDTFDFTKVYLNTTELEWNDDAQIGRQGVGIVGTEGTFNAAVALQQGGVPLGSAAFLPIDTDGTLAANSDAKLATQKAVKTYADQLIASADAMVFKGVIDCSANPNYPAADRGHTYRVSVAGKIGGASGVNVEVGDLLLCLTDSTASGNQATVGSSWSIAQANIDGAVTGPASATSGHVATFSGTSGKVIQDGGVLGSLAGLSTITSSEITDGTIVNGDINASAAIALSKLATDPLARANHTGTQLAATISDFNSAAVSATSGTYQPIDSDLTALAGLSGVRGDIIYRDATQWQRLVAGSVNTLLAMGANDPGWVSTIDGGSA